MCVPIYLFFHFSKNLFIIFLILVSTSTLFLVTLQAQREYPPDMQCKDKFLLQSTIVSRNIDVNEVPQDTVRMLFREHFNFLFFSFFFFQK